MQSFGGFLRELPKVIGQFDQCASLSLSIEQLALRDVDTQHFFKAHCLSTQLHSIRCILFGLSAFVFNGSDLPEIECRMSV